MVWENVPGAFSSNKGKDFQAVLEETIRVADKTATVPEPPKGKWSNAGCIVGNGYSVAWRVLDAQYWGVPQRRRRIFLVADFRGESAGEILFKRGGLRRDSAESREAGEGIAQDAQGCAGEAVGFCSDVASTLWAGAGAPKHLSDMLGRLVVSGDQGGIAVLDMTHACDVIRDCGEVVPTLQNRMGTGGN